MARMTRKDIENASIVQSSRNRSQSGLEDFHYIPISNIIPNPFQPRKFFDDESMKELVESIKYQGLLQPIVVSRTAESYVLIAGERRLRACKQLNMETIQSKILYDVSDSKLKEMSLAENVQRENLSTIEEANVYLDFLNSIPDSSYSKIADIVGKSKTHVHRLVNLVQKLSDEAKEVAIKNQIRSSNQLEIISSQPKEKQIELVTQISKGEIGYKELKNLNDINKDKKNVIENGKNENKNKEDNTNKVKKEKKKIDTLNMLFDPKEVLNSAIYGAEFEKVYDSNLKINLNMDEFSTNDTSMFVKSIEKLLIRYMELKNGI